MSISSRISGLFSSDQSSRVAAASDGAPRSINDDHEQDGFEFGVGRKNKRPRTMEKLEEEDDIEFSRPPYSHVRFTAGLALRNLCKEKKLTG